MFIAMTLAAALTQAAPTADPTTLERYAAIRDFAAVEGDGLWAGYGAAPFGILLIEADGETLVCRPEGADGFQAAGTDAATECPAFKRARSTLPDRLLAALPLFGPPSTIVMGTPASTGRTEAAWSRTILHEHFHQWQNALPDYYERVAALDLSGGDETGMWMLNYAFPYDRPEVVAAHRAASLALAAAVEARGTADFRRTLEDYLTARAAFAATVNDRDWRYAEFQLWQEGVARWTEIALGARYPASDVQDAAAALEAETLADLKAPHLAGTQREFAYAFGAGDAMLLEACGADWRAEYPTVMALGSLLARAAERCAAGA